MNFKSLFLTIKTKIKISEKGFTLIELLITVTLLAITASILGASYSGFWRQTELDTVTKNIISDIRLVQARAVAGQDGTNWGICIVNEEGGYYGYINSVTDCPETGSVNLSSPKKFLPGGISYSNILENERKAIIFTKISGRTIGDANDWFGVSSSVGERNIVIFAHGRVDSPSFFVDTSVASGITSSEAVLRGSINPNNAPAVVWFRLYTADPGECIDDSSGEKVPEGGISISSSVFTLWFSDTASVLSGGTAYYYCAVAESDAHGKALGRIIGFTTSQ